MCGVVFLNWDIELNWEVNQPGTSLTIATENQQVYSNLALLTSSRLHSIITV